MQWDNDNSLLFVSSESNKYPLLRLKESIYKRTKLIELETIYNCENKKICVSFLDRENAS
jgi:hypothetical protein